MLMRQTFQFFFFPWNERDEREPNRDHEQNMRLSICPLRLPVRQRLGEIAHGPLKY